MDPLEKELQQMAETFDYPPTPRFASQPQPRPTFVPVRALVWALAVGLFFIGLWAIPPVRAGILQLLQIGSIRIFFTTPTPPPSTLNSPSLPTPTPLYGIDNLAGQTTLADVQTKLDFPIHLPTYPTDLGLPDKVFYQETIGSVLISVWLADDQPTQPRLILYAMQLPDDILGGKFNVQSSQLTQVNGEDAFWIVGKHLLQFYDAQQKPFYQSYRFIAGNVLVWESEAITYRLETSLSLEEAIQIAESLR